MTAQRFLLSSAALFGLMVAAYLWLVLNTLLVGREVPFSYRQFLLESSAEVRGKVVVESGSNAIHAIDPLLLSAQLGVPVVTSADNAGYPLRLRLLNLGRFLGPGDTLVLPLEWISYAEDEVYADVFLHGLADERRTLAHYVSGLNRWQKLRFVLTRYPLRESVYAAALPRDPQQLLREDYRRLDDFERLAALGRHEAYGNSSRNGPEPMDGIAAAMSCDGYTLLRQLWHGFELSRVFRANLQLLQGLSARGINVVFTWPAVVDSAESPCYREPGRQEALARYTKAIRQTVSAAGFAFVGEPTTSLYGNECFLNTYYHLRADCQAPYTLQLATALQGLGVAGEVKQRVVAEAVLHRVKTLRGELREPLGEALLPIDVGGPAIGALSESVLLLEGWRERELWGVWSLGRESVIRVRLAAPSAGAEHLSLELQGRYFQGVEQTRVTVNGVFQGSYDLRGATIELDPATALGNTLDIRLGHGSPVSAADARPGLSKPTLKYGLQSLQLRAREAASAADGA